MRYYKIIIAAVLAVLLSACSFFSKENNEDAFISNGLYECQVSLTGGSGKAYVESPAQVTVTDDGMTVRLVWSSSNYDYMIVDDIRYENEAGLGENSTFTIWFSLFDKEFTVIGNTTAMSTPHEIEYGLTVYAPGEKGNSVEKNALDPSDLTEENTQLELGNLKIKNSLELKYATGFSVDYYIDESDNEYALISINGAGTNQHFLKSIGDASTDSLAGISDNVILLDDISNTYLVSTSVMDLIAKIDGLSDIRFSGTKATDWYIPEAVDAMESGEILYAGKYSAPDYELLVSRDCNFAIENTMIFHNPEVKEKLEELGIPVIIETSSNENNPLARLEWIKLYGVLFDRLDKAESVFNEQVDRVEAIMENNDTEKMVAFFSINSSGQITVRESGDYVSTMINMAGGYYVPDDLTDSDALSTMKISMEDFYIAAVDADVLIYNSTIEGEINGITELIKEAPSLADFKAIKNGDVYCLKEGYFQRSVGVAEFIEELNDILKGSYKEGECFYKLED